MAAFPEPLHDDLHHPVRDPDSLRPSAALLDSALYAGQGMVPDAEAGAARPVVDREAGSDQPARTPRPSRPPTLARSGALVASRGRRALVAQRPDLLRPGVRDRPLDAARAVQ